MESKKVLPKKYPWLPSTVTRTRSKVDVNSILQINANFSDLQDNRKILEIGFGKGENLLANAKLHSDISFTGIELFTYGAGFLAKQALSHNLDNLHILVQDCREYIQHTTTKFNGIFVLFPDPWNKRRQHKRRLIQLDFIASLAQILQPDGWLWIATDHLNYSSHIDAVLSAQPYFTYQKRPLPVANKLQNTVSHWRGFELVSTIYHNKNLANSAASAEFLCQLKPPNQSTLH